MRNFYNRLYQATKPYKQQEANISVIYDWRRGDYEPALQHAEIRQFLYEHREHQAILHWNASHNQRIEPASLAIEPASAQEWYDITVPVQVLTPRPRRPSLLSLNPPWFALDPTDPHIVQAAFNFERNLQQQSAASLPDALPLETDTSNLPEPGELLDSDSASTLSETVLYRRALDLTPELPDANYNLLLIWVAGFAAVSAGTLVVATLAIASIIHLSTAATAMVLVTGIGSALAAHSLFKSQDNGISEPSDSSIELPSFPLGC